jgi:hypothetical protein
VADAVAEVEDSVEHAVNDVACAVAAAAAVVVVDEGEDIEHAGADAEHIEDVVVGVGAGAEDAHTDRNPLALVVEAEVVELPIHCRVHKMTAMAQEEGHGYAEAGQYDEVEAEAAGAETNNVTEEVGVHDVGHTKDGVHANEDVVVVEADVVKDAGYEKEVAVEAGVDVENAVGEGVDVGSVVCVPGVLMPVEEAHVHAARTYDLDNVHPDVHTPEQVSLQEQMQTAAAAQGLPDFPHSRMVVQLGQATRD